MIVKESSTDLREKDERERQKEVWIMDKTMAATPQCSFIKSKERTTNYPKWCHWGCRFQGIRLLFKISLIQNLKRPRDCVVAIANIWAYYKFFKNMNGNKKDSTIN